VAIPSVPQSMYVQQMSGQVLVTWSLSAGATSYQVQRSTDNVTFAVVSSPAATQYLDTSVTINTQYYYRVASTNADGTSPYTNASSVIPTLSGQLSLGELRQRSQERADRVNSQFVTLPEWNFFIREAAYELYDMLITAYEDYYLAPRLTFQTDGSSNRYALPNGANYSGAPALYKLYGVDLGQDSTANAQISIKKFNFIQRNRYVYPQLTSTFLGVFNLRYRAVGSDIMFIPTPAAGQVIGLWYYPRLARLLLDTDTLDGVSGWEQYVIVRAAKYALDKEESDTSKLDQEVMFLKQRIEAAAQNRDAGQGDTISDTRTRAETWGGYGPNGDGSYGGW